MSFSPEKQPERVLEPVEMTAVIDSFLRCHQIEDVEEQEDKVIMKWMVKGEAGGDDFSPNEISDVIDGSNMIVLDSGWVIFKVPFYPYRFSYRLERMKFKGEPERSQVVVKFEYGQ